MSKAMAFSDIPYTISDALLAVSENPICGPARHQHRTAGHRHLHGHDPGAADLHPDLPAGCSAILAWIRCILV